MIRRQFAAALLLVALLMPYAAFAQQPQGTQTPAPDQNDPQNHTKAPKNALPGYFVDRIFPGNDIFRL